MKNYLSFGGGVNSVALYLLLMEQGLEPGNWVKVGDYNEVYHPDFGTAVCLAALKAVEEGK